ncbi:hypothetical protein DXG01_000431 [Tephrocybe rancida]|nr:hypothetical protein DXG01_000431 [Tephrocybe rancida]
MVCLELMTGEQPFNNIPQDYHALRELDRGKVPERPGRLATAQGLNDDLWSLMKACWHKKPESRPTMTVIKTRLSEMRGTTIGIFVRFHNCYVTDAWPASIGKICATKATPIVVASPRSKPAPALTILSQRVGTLPEDNGFAGSAIGSSLDKPRPSDSLAPGALLLSRGSPSLSGHSELGTANLAIPSSASSSPSFSRTSSDSHSAPRSTVSIDSGIQVNSSVEDVVTEKRPTVHVDKGTGTVLSGTLEGLIEKLISGLERQEDYDYRESFFIGCTDFITWDDLFGILVRKFHEAGWVPGQPQRRVTVQLKTSEISPTDIAIALTLLEGDKYKAILPIDYIAHLTRKRRSNVEAACLTNTTIVLWVKQSVLNYDTIRKRAKALGFFVNTAKARNIACLTFHNYSSATAIIRALHSEPIKRLRLTDEELSRDSPKVHKTLGQLHSLLDPSSNYQNYRTTLQEKLSKEVGDRCIPWIFAHLENSRLSLPEIPRVVGVDGIPLINFEPYVRFTERVKEMMQYKPPDLEKHRQQGHLAYLEKELREVHSNTDNELMKRSEKLEADEALAKQGRTREMKGLGFRT